MYQITPQQISQSARKTLNAKILSTIGTGNSMSAEEIYNGYTGIAGLHELKQADFSSYHDFAQAKREAEMGQFFTPHEICRKMVEAIQPQPNEMVLDMCCGMGNFFNFLPNEHNAYGFDIDPDAIKVAKHLYPNANIELANICTHNPEERFDIVIGNPPFNLDFDGVQSQYYYCNKAYWMLKPSGLMMMVVPVSFLQNEFWERSKVNAINRDFSFIGQTKLSADAFKSVGVDKFDTKIMVFMRESKNIDMKPYNAEEFVSMEELAERIAEAKGITAESKLQIQQEAKEEVSAENREFEYKLKKYLYEIKTHKSLQKHYDKSIALVAKFRNQRPPEGCSVDERKEWDKRKLTYKKVLAVLKRYIKNQNVVPRKEVALVKTNYGFKLKGYAPRLLDKVEVTAVSLKGILAFGKTLPHPEKMTAKLRRQYAAAEKYIERKRKEYELQSSIFPTMKRDEALDKDINTLTFFNKEMQACSFTELQKHDMGLVFQKRYALLNWQQGSGKTAVAYYYSKHRRINVKNTVILAPAIAIHLTWEPFLKRHSEKYIIASKPEHLVNIPKGYYVLLSLTMIGELVAPLKEFMKVRSNKVCLLFDESDEITNPSAQRTRQSLNIFRRAKYKLLATGTTTRNNIGELYSQFELLYNNSVNMMCDAYYVYFQNKDGEIEMKRNDRYLEPFPARGGSTLFKACFCPGKASVFGIEKQNQDVYNQEHLAALIEKTIITRKFKEFAGEKYEIINYTVTPSDGERAVYRTILEKFHEILHLYYNPIKDKKKESQLNLVRQIQLLIKACSVPHQMSGYFGEPYPQKAITIENKLRYELKGKVAIGCTSIDAVELYTNFLSERFPERPLFVVRGNVDFKKRQKILDKFEKTENGLLVCTQQSLKSSANVPSCEDIIIESLQWNIPRMEQFYFRFIRLDSVGMRRVHYLTYEESIEQNLMALILTKERLNEFIKSGEVKEESEIFEEFDISPDIIETLFRREQDDQGKFHIRWGAQKVS